MFLPLLSSLLPSFPSIGRNVAPVDAFCGCGGSDNDDTNGFGVSDVCGCGGSDDDDANGVGLNIGGLLGSNDGTSEGTRVLVTSKRCVADTTIIMV